MNIKNILFIAFTLIASIKSANGSEILPASVPDSKDSDFTSDQINHKSPSNSITLSQIEIQNQINRLQIMNHNGVTKIWWGIGMEFVSGVLIYWAVDFASKAEERNISNEINLQTPLAILMGATGGLVGIWMIAQGSTMASISKNELQIYNKLISKNKSTLFLSANSIRLSCSF